LTGTAVGINRIVVITLLASLDEPVTTHCRSVSCGIGTSIKRKYTLFQAILARFSQKVERHALISHCIDRRPV
jgi:hypothetical protein